MADLVIFAGPVIVKQTFKNIPWKTPTTIVPIQGAGSTHFANLAASLKDGQGRILPNLLRQHAHVSRQEVGKLYLCAYSAGWGLLNALFKVDADREEVDACVLTDAAFGTGLHGHAKYAADAIRGDKLMVATTTNNSANASLGILKTARSTWLDIQQEAIGLAQCYCEPGQVSARAPMPEPSGGVWKTGGSLYWYDYVKPGSADNQGNDLTHGEHHDLAPAAWTAYLANPPFGVSSLMGWKQWVGAGVAAAGLLASYLMLRKPRRV
jgi:hypothetical protein